MVDIQARKTRDSLLNEIAAFSYALEVKDKDVSDHSKRVAEVAVAIAQGLGLPQDNIDKIRLAGLVHDIGMIGVRESVLNKQERLTESEYRHITYHCEVGEHILAPVVKDESILKMVRHHHERYDGGGYPDGLHDEQIPWGARILMVAEAYDAMTYKHPYREAMSPEVARADIVFCRGTQFDPMVADVFLSLNYKHSTLLQ